MATHTIRTTMRPDVEITVDEAEYEYLFQLGLIYTGTAPLPASDFYDGEIADRIKNGTETRQALADAVNDGGPFELAQRAAFAAAVIQVKRDHGAVGDGVTDDSAAFAAAAAAAKAALRTMPFSLQADSAGSVVIEIPAGDYVITNPGALLGNEAMSTKGVGLVFRGAGNGISNIIFKPSSAGALITNDYWQDLKFQDLGFWAATSGCTFMQSYTTHSAQAYNFTSCRFNGFKYGFDLQGSNNNSEFIFNDCHSTEIEDAGAFFYIGTTNTSDQFLNYWFYGCTHMVTSAPFIDAAAGGHFHINGLDVSDWGSALTGPGYLFALRGTSHAFGVCHFEASGVRVEAKNADAALLYSEWGQGDVTFRSVDWSSQTAVYTYGDIIYVNYVNTDGAAYAFYDSTLAGTVRVHFSTNDWQHQHAISFTGCTWLQKNSPTDVVVYDTTGNSNSLASPPVEFIRCRGAVLVDILSAGGGATWDAKVGYRGQLLQSLTPRVLSVRSVYGVLAGTDVATVTLPVGAIITDFEALSPAGAVTEGDGGSWTLATTESTPTTVATATVSGAMSAGFDVDAKPATPFLCGTQAQATLTITPSGVSQYNSSALLLIKGYW